MKNINITELYTSLGEVEFKILILQNELEVLIQQKEKYVNEIYKNNTDVIGDVHIADDDQCIGTA